MLAVSADKPDLAAAQRLTRDATLNAILHSTCVATMLNAGVQENALPARAIATIQCRIMPDETVDGTKAAIAQVFADPAVKVDVLGQVITSPESPPSPVVFHKIETVVHSMWPGVAIVPSMSAGASDSIFTRNGGIPSYGVSGGWIDIHDIRAHGRDERREEHAFYESVEFTHRLMMELTKAE
jgi:acetylornithine deacetylase/succinyl-diaminopimelate desuccinylase-like protein